MSMTRGTSPPTLPPIDQVYRITVDQYERMVASGALGKDDPIELLSGVLVRKMPKSPEHTTSSDLCREAIRAVLPAGWYVRQEQAVRIPDFDEPEPDLAVVRGSIRTYARRHPGPQDIALLVEVATTAKSLGMARGEKLRAYSRSGIAVYWIVNLAGKTGRIEVHSRPTRTRGYRSRTIYSEADTVVVPADGRQAGQICVTEILP
jgi:Uma2 family endonuclease